MTSEEPVNCDDVIYLDTNGVTIKACDEANAGNTGVIDGVTYTVVDFDMLLAMVSNEEDVTKVVTSLVTNMSLLFLGNGGVFNQDISSWDTSNVTEMVSMFNSASAFNQDISFWDVSSVNTMLGMFTNASEFNQDISSWDVSSVIFMSQMFYGATAFNQPLDNWDVSNSDSMQKMFYGATAFNQDISNWDVSNVLICEDFSTGAPPNRRKHPQLY